MPCSFYRCRQRLHIERLYWPQRRDVLDRRPADNAYLAGPDYASADMAVWPCCGGLAMGVLYEAGEFLQVQDCAYVRRWAEAIGRRSARVAGAWSTVSLASLPVGLRERHDASDSRRKRRTASHPQAEPVRKTR